MEFELAKDPNLKKGEKNKVSVKLKDESGLARVFQIVTANQAAEEIGCKVNDINMRVSTISTATKSTYLDYCFPFQSDGKNGPKFIVVNQKYLDYKESYKSRK